MEAIVVVSLTVYLERPEEIIRIQSFATALTRLASRYSNQCHEVAEDVSISNNVEWKYSIFTDEPKLASKSIRTPLFILYLSLFIY